MTAVRSLSRRDAAERPTRLRLVRPRPGRELGWTATIALCVIGLFGALVVSVAIQGQRIALQEEADRVAARTADATDRNRQLRIEVIQAESPEHVLEAARSAGMVEPGPVAMLPSATDPTAAAPAAAPSTAAPSTSAPSTSAPTTVARARRTPTASTVPRKVAAATTVPVRPAGVAKR